MSETLDVIAVGAHPDDVEIGIGGTIARLAQQGHSVGIVDLTDGEPTPASPGPEVRLAEARAAAELLGAKRITLDLPNRRLFDSFESRLALARVLRRYRPRLVFGLVGKTPLASPDHWQAAQITDAAVFYSRLSKWEEHFDDLPVHSVPKLLHYTLNFELAWAEKLPHAMVHDISDTLERKMQAIECYETQFPPAKQYLFRRVRALAQAIGASAGYDAGEMLLSTRAVGTRDLMASLELDCD